MLYMKGASSLVGLFAEVGPYILNEKLELMANPYSWNKKANLLFVEFGVGIGFSFCKNSTRTDIPCTQTNTTCSPCASSDSQIVSHNLAFLEQFLSGSDALFPELNGRELFITGESYAGVYIPTLAKAIVESKALVGAVKLIGTWATDPCMDNKAQFGWLDADINFALSKSVISTATHDAIKNRCTARFTKVGDRIRKVHTSECKGAWRLYDMATAGVGDAVHAREVPGLPMYVDPLNVYGPSTEVNIPGYIDGNRKSLGATLSPNKVYHLELGNNGYDNYHLEYAACNNNAVSGMPSMVQVYQAIAAHVKAGTPGAEHLRTIVISSGDIDPVVALQGTEAAVDAMAFPLAPGALRRPWFYNATGTSLEVMEKKPVAWGQALHANDAGVQVGGFTATYDAGPGLELHFVTMRDSGHMVPQYAPQKVEHVIDELLHKNTPLAPVLQKDWDTSSDEKFYGWNTTDGGDFTRWVGSAMSAAGWR